MAMEMQPEQLFISGNTIVYRLRDPESQKTNIIKSLAREHPTSSDIAKFLHQYEILSHLRAVPGVIPADEKLLFKGYQSLRFPDLGGEPLGKLLNRPIDIGAFFKLALSVTETLSQIHALGVIHKDINPNNILTLPDFSKAWLIDFSIASKTQREVQVVKPAQHLEGTLQYLPPEQSGRINRTLDYRADYYSLGITFFEILTGQRPFHSEDIMELLHAHMVTPLPDLNLLRKDLPKSIALLVKKLAAKDPDDRYQSTWGLLSDLKKAQELWTQGDLTGVFPLGSNDFSEQLLIPEKIYGRENEIDVLVSIFEESQKPLDSQSDMSAASLKGGRLTLITGVSGVGKSSLIHELIRPVTEKGGYLVEGKVDQFQRDVLLFGFKEAFISLFDLLAGEIALGISAQSSQQVSKDILTQIKMELEEKLKSNIGIITDSIPELSVYLGEYSKPQLVRPEETRKRLLESFATLFQIIASKRSLLFFLDDLQWADRTTLDLIEHLSKMSIPGLMLMGAYRSNEVEEGHPLYSVINNLTGYVTTVDLQPLQDSAVRQLLADTLGNGEDLSAVTEKIIRKTAGNPFFVHQLLKQLYADEIILRDPQRLLWVVDLLKLDALNVSTNVVDFLLIKLRELHPTIQNFLSHGAARGSRFELSLVAQLLHADPNTLIEAIRKAVDEEIIHVIQGSYQHLLSSQNVDSSNGFAFQFLHDRLQQASYELKTESDRKLIHFSIAELLSADAEEKQDSITITEQYLKSEYPNLDPEHRVRISTVFLKAAIQSKTSGEYKKAFEYVRKSQAFLDEKFWSSHSDFLRQQYLQLSDISFRAREHQVCREANEILLRKSRTQLEQAESYKTMSDHAFFEDKGSLSIRYGLKGLSCLGLNFSKNASIFVLSTHLFKTLLLLKRAKRGEDGILSVLKLPEVKDPRILMSFRLMTAMSNSAYQTLNLNLIVQLVCFAIQLILKHGLSEFASYWFGSMGVVLNAMQRYDLVEDMFRIGLVLVSRSKVNTELSADSYYVAACINGWTNCNKLELNNHYQRVFDLALETRATAGAIAKHFQLDAEVFLTPIDTLFENYKTGRIQMVNMGVIAPLKGFDLSIAFLKCLSSKTEQESKLNYSNLLMCQQKANQVNTLSFVFVGECYRAIFSYLFDSPDKAESEFRSLYQSKLYHIALASEVRFELFYSLALLGGRRAKKKYLSPKYVVQISKIRKRFKRLNAHRGDLFGHFYHLLEAEYAIYRSKSFKIVANHYVKAAELAKGASNFLIEGLANEKAGEYFLTQENNEVAGYYIRKSRVVFAKWQAWARVNYLNNKYPEYFQDEANTNSNLPRTLTSLTGTIESPLTTLTSSTTIGAGTVSEDRDLDLNEVLKAARSLSSEVVLARLTEKVLKTVSEVSGAEWGALLMPESQGLFKVNSCFHQTKTPENVDVPISLIDKVRIKKEPLIIADATKDPILKQDPYFKDRVIRSIACLPTMSQGNISAILYLENNEVAGAFTTSRMKTLFVLASQTAISIENAKLYETLEDKVQEKTRDIQAILTNLQQGIFTLRKDFTIHPEYSTYLEVILGETSLAGKNPLPLLLKNSSLGSNSENQIQVALTVSLGENIFNFELNSHLLPREITRKTLHGTDQFLELDWKPLCDQGGSVDRILVTLRDVTELKRLQSEADGQKAELEMIGEVLECGLDTFQRTYEHNLKYIEENRKILRQIDSDLSPSIEILNLLFRNLHTVKGNVRTLGLSYAVDAVHETEQFLDSMRKMSWQKSNIDKLETDLNQAEEALKRYFRLKQSKLSAFNHSELNDSEYGQQEENILDLLRSESILSLTVEEKGRMIERFHDSLASRRLRDLLRSELKSISGLASALGKSVPQVDIQDGGDDGVQYSFLDKNAFVLRDILTHCFRNSIDHGLESNEERKAKGKSEIGRIQIKVLNDSATPHYKKLLFFDDGKGLNLGKLRANGIKSGACSELSSDLEVAELIFQAGVSTAESVTHLSGRGVGMDAIRSLIESSGGKLQIEFTGEKTQDGFRPFQLVFSIPINWVSEVRKKESYKSEMKA